MTRHPHTLLIGALATTAIALPAVASAAGAPSHAPLWKTPSGNVNCGIAAYPKNDLLCSAKVIPAPKGSTSADGDPGFVLLGASGAPKPIRTSQYSWANMSDKFVALANGSTWSTHGVTCKVSTSSVTCTNGSGHGFTAGAKYKAL